MDRRRLRRGARTFLIELLLYGVVVVAYFFLVLRYLQMWLGNLYQNNLVTYAFVSLGVIVAQGIFLEIVTSFLLNHLRFGQRD